MARQMGSHISFLLKAETVYGTLPSGNWNKAPILDFDPGVANDIQADPAIGFGHRESSDVFRGPIDVKPKITVPVDVSNIGYWMKALFGTYSVSGAGPYVHVFKAAVASVVPSLGLEAGYPDANGGAGKYLNYPGFCINKGSFDFAPTGPAKLSLDGIAKTETPNNTSQGGTPTVATYVPFQNIQGSVLLDTVGSTTPSAAIANLVGATLNIANNLEAQPGIGTGGLILGVDAGQLIVTGELTLCFDTTTLYDDAQAATNVSLGLGYTIDANTSLRFVLPRVALGRSSPAIKGPGGIMAKFPFQAQRDTTANASIIATLTNGVAAY